MVIITYLLLWVALYKIEDQGNSEYAIIELNGRLVAYHYAPTMRNYIPKILKQKYSSFNFDNMDLSRPRPIIPYVHQPLNWLWMVYIFKEKQ